MPETSLRVKLAVLGIVLFGASLRLWTIGDGVPFTIGVDEPEIVDRAVTIMKSGDFNPHFFDYPGLTIYLHTAVASARFIAGAMSRNWTTLGQVSPADFYLWSRIATALLGALTIAIVYRAALRWGVTVALVATLMMAVLPPHVRESHFALTDTPLTFFVALTMLLTLTASEDGRLRSFMLAGFAAGLAAATKYNGMLALIMPIVAALTAPMVQQRAAAIVVAIAAAGGGFLLGAPYTLFDLPSFLNSFAALLQHYNQDASGGVRIYLKHIRGWFGAPWNPYSVFGFPAFVLVGVGLVATAANMLARQRRAAALTLATFPLVYFWVIAHQSLMYNRYVLPLAPAVCVLLGVGFNATVDALRQRMNAARVRWALPILLLIVTLPPLGQAIGFDLEQRKVSTPEQTAEWIVRHVRPEEPIILETYAIRLPPTFKSDNVPRLISTPLDVHRQKGVVYLVASSMEYQKWFGDPARFSGNVAAYNAIFAGTDPIITIVPTPEHPGPTFKIMRIRK